MAYRQFITWPDDLNCLVLLLFPDWMPLMWMRGVHKHAVRHDHCFRTVTQICANKETSLQEGKAEDPAACEDLTDIFYTPAWLFTCKRPVYFLQIAAAPSTQFLHMEAVPEGQQEILAHPQSFKILSWGASCTKLWTTRRKRWVYTFHRIKKSLREKGTSKGHWDGDASGACVQSRQAGPRLLGFVRCWCDRDMLEMCTVMYGAGTRLCLQGNSCMGRHPSLHPFLSTNSAETWQEGKQQFFIPFFVSRPPRRGPGTRRHSSTSSLPPHPILPCVVTTLLLPPSPQAVWDGNHHFPLAQWG